MYKFMVDLRLDKLVISGIFRDIGGHLLQKNEKFFESQNDCHSLSGETFEVEKFNLIRVKRKKGRGVFMMVVIRTIVQQYIVLRKAAGHFSL